MNLGFIGTGKIASSVITGICQSKITYKKIIISFEGILNAAKGYDLFGSAIVKILDKYKNWKAIVIGDG